MDIILASKSPRRKILLEKTKLDFQISESGINEKNLKLTLRSKPTIQTHSNVMMHIFGFFSKEFSILERDKFFELQDDFKNEKITIGEILAKINPTIYRFNKIYLTSQTYFLLYSNPDPRNIFKILKKEE